MTACTQAVVGSDLAVLTTFIEKLMLAQPMLLFKYQDLKNVFQKLVLTFPCLRENYPGQDSGAIAKKLAEQTMTLACHARRLRDPTRFRECCKGLCEWQVMKLQNLREELARLAEDYEDEQVELDTRVKVRKCEEKIGEGGILKKACSILKKPSTKQAEFDSFVESLELPATQDSCAESMSCPETPSKILKAAEETSPVPSRKKTLKDQIKTSKGTKMKKMKVKKAPGKGLVKVKKEKKDKKDKKIKTKDMVLTQSDRDKLFLMPYKKTGRMAVRIRNGRQLFQISCHQDLKSNSQEAAKLMKALQNGKSLAEVLERRDKMHSKMRAK